MFENEFNDENYDGKNIYNELINFYNNNPNFEINGELGFNIISKSIEIDDIEIIKLILSKDFKFNNDIFTILPYCGEEKFLLITDYIIKSNQVNELNINYNKNFIYQILDSRSSTYKMLEVILKYFKINNLNKELLACLICNFKREDLIKELLLSDNDIDLFDYDKNGETLIKKIEKIFSPETYLIALEIA